MITLRRSDERHHERRHRQEAWLSFQPGMRAAPFTDGFGLLEILNEDRLSPGAVLPSRKDQGAEVVTYVCEGALAYEDSLGGSGVIQEGEFQRMIDGHGLRHSETNASRTDSAHVFQIGLRPMAAGIEPGREQQRFGTANRRDGLCIIASPDARRGSLRIHQDAFIYSALLRRGQHVIHEILSGRSAWLHLVQGEVTLGEVVLTTGDGAGITDERAVSFTAREDAEVLLLDLGSRPRPPNSGGLP